MKKHLLFLSLLAQYSLVLCAASSSDGLGGLTEQFATLGINEQTGQYRNTRLMNAVIKADTAEVLELMVVNKANPHIPDINGITPLMTAAANGYINIVVTLLGLCSDRKTLLTTKTPQGYTALGYAQYYQQPKIVEILTREQNQIPLCETYFSPNILNAINKLIENEQRGIRGSIYSFTHGTPAQKLVQKRAAGVTVTLIINKDYQKDLCIALRYMLNNGISIGIPKNGSNDEWNGGSFNMHHKFLIFLNNALNKPLLMTGSCNFTDQAFNRNWEDMIVTDNIESIQSYINQFDKRLFVNSTKITAEQCTSAKDTSNTNLAVSSRERNCVNDLK